MTASILIVGENYFLAALLDRVHDLADCTLETAPSPSEAVPLIQAQQPDLLLLQASPDSLCLCQQIKEQSRLAWIYCLLISDVVEEVTPKAAEISGRSMELRAEALEQGA